MKSVLVTGASGFLGSHVARCLDKEGYKVTGTYGSNPVLGTLKLSSLPLDLTIDESIENVFNEAKPELVVHAAAMADLKPCEERPELAGRINTDATAVLAGLCKERGARLIFFSTDQVFNGEEGGYSETHAPSPIHVYGKTKAKAEELILERSGLCATVVRVTLVYGRSPTGRRSCSEQVLKGLEQGERPRLFTDEIRSPLLAEDLAAAILELAQMNPPVPLIHLGGPESLSRFEIGQAIARAFGYEEAAFDKVKRSDLNLVPHRPGNLSFDTALARKVLARPPRPLQDGLLWLATHRGEGPGKRSDRGPP
jgi:dTDP-4-dehydrorhamnose reductase